MIFISLAEIHVGPSCIGLAKVTEHRAFTEQRPYVRETCLRKIFHIGFPREAIQCPLPVQIGTTNTQISRSSVTGADALGKRASASGEKSTKQSNSHTNGDLFGSITSAGVGLSSVLRVKGYRLTVFEHGVLGRIGQTPGERLFEGKRVNV
ncbi:hypothetical protein CBL_10901 [Carabus blaptoides fortunei]